MADALRQELAELRALVDEGFITMADYEHQSMQFLEECMKRKLEVETEEHARSLKRKLEQEAESNKERLEVETEEHAKSLKRKLVQEEDLHARSLKRKLRRKEEIDRMAYALRVTLTHGSEYLSPKTIAEVKAGYLELVGLEAYASHEQPELAPNCRE